MHNNIGYRPTWAEVNLNNLAHNFYLIKKRLAPGTKVLVTVKADAYGHGLVRVAGKLVSCGVDFFGVASIDEGIALRKNKIKAPILVLGALLKEDIPPLFTYRLTPTVSSLDLAEAIDKKARALGRKMNVHVKIDTGMGRLGILYAEAGKIVEKISRLKYLRIEGIFTHLACADTKKDFTLYQIGVFKRLVSTLCAKGIKIRLKHTANSMGVIGYKEGHFNMVRPGLVIYGLYPGAGLAIKLRPVLSLKTKVVFLKQVPGGYGISYGQTYITKNKTKIVILPIGYGDGYPRNLSNLAPVLIKGRRFKISGRVCMDQIMVDVGDLPVKVGDEAVLIGSQGNKTITSEELAELAGTIPYEIVCGLGSRVPRIYVD
jgi:alanine racemase